MATHAVLVFVLVFIPALVSAFIWPPPVTHDWRSMKRKAEDTDLASSSRLRLSSTALMAVNELADQKKKAISESAVFSEEELSCVVKAMRNILGESAGLDEEGSRRVSQQFAHTSHKIWERTEEESIELEKVLPAADSNEFKRLLFRVLEGGNWDGAMDHALSNSKSSEPQPKWAVLITGLNGIRKSTSVYQAWFQDVLYESLVKDGYEGEKFFLPTGQTTFFRQLDYIVATLANEDFRQLYDIPSGDVDAYATLKDAIFARYRKLAEMVGMLLIRLARQSSMNVMVETSGRDVAMYRYIDYCFPAEDYKKLVVHFTINDIAFACESVDRRMTGEIRTGATALASLRASSSGSGSSEGTEGDSPLNAVPAAVRGLIEANAGGPYGSAVLPGVEAASNEVWATVKDGSAGVGQDWLKASIEILAHKDKDWEARPSGGGTTHVFRR